MHDMKREKSQVETVPCLHPDPEPDDDSPDAAIFLWYFSYVWASGSNSLKERRIWGLVVSSQRRFLFSFLKS